jgi:gamma-hexachlorocyclohexane dehydrochlorinase
MTIDKLDYAVSRFALQDLSSDYCHGFDKHDYDRLLEIWWEDAVLEMGPPYGTFEGRASIMKAVEAVLWPAWKSTAHFTTNHTIVFSGTDTACGLCDVFCLGTTAAGESVTITASYHDEFERRKGIWRFRKRRISV